MTRRVTSPSGSESPRKRSLSSSGALAVVLLAWSCSTASADEASTGGTDPCASAGAARPAVCAAFDNSVEAPGLELVVPTERFGSFHVLGKSGQAMALYGGMRYALSHPLDLDTYTLQYWFRIDDLDGVRCLKVFRSALMELTVPAEGCSFAVFREPDGARHAIQLNTLGNPLTSGRWHHVAVTRSALRVAAYLDGVKHYDRPRSPAGTSSSAPAAADEALANTIDFGEVDENRTGALLSFDDLRIYDVARSAAEIAHDALAGERPPWDGQPLWSIQGELRFDGRPITEFTSVTPTLWLRNEVTGSHRPVTSEVDGASFVLHGLEPGRYGLAVSVDTDQNRNSGSPGDYDGFFHVTVERWPRDLSRGLELELQQLIHLTAPQDNGGPMPGWDAPCLEKPAFVGPVEFAWKPLAGDVRYRYDVRRVTCEPFAFGEIVVSGETDDTTATLDLPPNRYGEIYGFEIRGRSGDRHVGRFVTSGKSGHGWDYRFRVVEP